MARLPSTISLMRRGGTPIACASAVCDSAIGFKNSSIRISPGWGFGSSVIIDDLDLVRMAFLPDKANPPLIVDPDRVLPASITSESLKPIGGRHTQIIEPSGIVEKTQLAKRASLNVRRQPATGVARPD